VIMKKQTVKMIKQAIDSYPGGICFATLDGRVILVNEKMNELVNELLGHTILNAKVTWEKLEQCTDSPTSKRLNKSWFTQSLDETTDNDHRRIFFQFADKSVWRFEWQLIDKNTVQIEAAEITRLYQLSEELHENNVHLHEMQERQKSLLDNIVQINQNKEILAIKMRIHDEFGNCLLATQKAISEQNLPENVEELRENWSNTIRNFSNIPMIWSVPDAALQSELLQVAELIGCKVNFIGDQPAERLALRLVYASVREALTNAVRHADATELTVQIDKSVSGYHIEISSNGAAVNSEIKEGNGLSGLRRRLEQEGAILKILYNPGVTLVVDVPTDVIKPQKGENK